MSEIDELNGRVEALQLSFLALVRLLNNDALTSSLADSIDEQTSRVGFSSAEANNGFVRELSDISFSLRELIGSD